MSKILIKTERIQDKIICFADLQLEKSNCLINFTSNNKAIYILSTSNGYIYKNNLMCKQKKVSVYLNNEDDKDMECLISYLDNENNLLSYECLKANIDTFSIVNNPIKSTILQTTEGNLNAKQKLNNFLLNLNNMQSQWKIDLNFDRDDIIVQINTQGTSGLFAFGTESEQINKNDLLLNIESNINKITIPSEIVNKFSNNTVGLYELVKPSFLQSANTLFKIKASNKLNITNKINTRKMSDYKMPCGQNFNPSLWKLSSLYLPIYTETR